MRKKCQIDIPLLITLLILETISILSIFSAQKLLASYMSTLFLKQLLWYTLGYLIIFIVLKLKVKYFYDRIWYAYWFGNFLLLLLLFFGEPVNDAKCWFQIPGIGSFQPSEFMKIILILVESIMINNFYKKNKIPSLKQEFLFLIKIGIIVFIPSILTFLEPDTGVVLIYLIITITILFISGIRIRWFWFSIAIAFLFLSFLIGLYFINQNLFLKIFGTSFFLRIDRLLDWSTKSGYQLENGLAAIGSAGLFGHGFRKTPIYFPEPQTDFIFAVYASNFGLIGSIFLLSILAYLDIHIIKIAISTKKRIYKYTIAGIVGMLIYQQFQNIGMTFGLMPITGITLPFISYGGSSLLSYLFMLGIVFSIANEKRI